MSSLIFFCTRDDALAAQWERQLPAGQTAWRLDEVGSAPSPRTGVAAIIVLDVAAESMLLPPMLRIATILVGEPRSLPLEQARRAKRAKAYLSYEESGHRLGEILMLVEEIAEKQSLIGLFEEKSRRSEWASTSLRPPGEPSDSAEFWDFLEGTVENLDSRDRLLAEFRRASRTLLHASHTVFFLRDPTGFRADRGTSSFPMEDPLVGFFENHPAVIDGNLWDQASDPVAELTVRNRLALWGARMLVPIHDNGRLLGLIALGVRDDGRPYGETERTRAVFLARLLRHCLTKATQLTRLNLIAEQTGLSAKYLPQTLVLSADEHPPRHVPVVVRDLIGQAQRARKTCRVAAAEGQPFRAGAGIVAETGGVWAVWEEASAEIRDAVARERSSRKQLLREMALTLSHEVGNALVSLAMMRQLGGSVPPPSLLETAKSDIAKLETLNRQLGLLQALHESETRMSDMREMIRSIGKALQIKVEVGPDPVNLPVAQELLDFALRALIGVVAENRAPLGTQELTMQLRSTGEGEECTALVSVRGRQLELEGIFPEPKEGEVPNQGRLGVFLAKEIIRLHRGEIHAGPGMEGTEILISLRSLPGKEIGQK